MSSRYLKNNTKAKKGISPVIATVILVAVAVVIAAALAGFSSSLFGSYSQSAQIAIRTLSVDAEGEGIMEVVNRGGSAETISAVSITNFGAATTIEPSGAALAPAVIPANGEETINFSGLSAMTAGQTVTVTVTTQSGQAYTISTVVQDDITLV